MNDEIISSAEEILDDITPFSEKMSESESEFDIAQASEENEEASENISDVDDEMLILRAELDSLKKELEEKKSAFERISRDIGEFSELFPTHSINSIPDSVWESVKSGIPLAAAYALYEKKTSARLDVAARVNSKNNELSTGAVGRSSTENFYTPDEVRSMSRSEVRKNYSKIIESMKKWN